jgi:branched-chain amino acid transport system permease protein
MSPVQQAAGQAPAPVGQAVRVTRSRQSALWSVAGAVVLVAVLAYLPYVVFSGTTTLLVQFFYLVTMASMWNLLAGYAGLVSVGLQAFVGLGAYFLLILAQHGTDPFLGLPVAALICGVAGLLIWWLVSRLRTGYFAIATWVIASVCFLIIVRYPSLGGDTGLLLPGLPNISQTLLTAYTYWIGLAVTVIMLAGIYLVLRSRLGLVLTAVRDDETGARSIGARVSRAQLLVFVIAAVGCGAAGALEAISVPFVQPDAAFAVAWTAKMIFAVLIGGIGSIEGPILGTIVFLALQQWLANYGTWYFIVLGCIAMAVAIWAPRGLWGFISERLNIRLFPVGYVLWPAAEAAGPQSRGLLPGLWRRPGSSGSSDLSGGSDSSAGSDSRGGSAG